MQDKHPSLICDTICGMGIAFPQVSKLNPTCISLKGENEML